MTDEGAGIDVSMNITKSMMTNQYVYNLNQINQNMMTQENQMATGKTLNLPSDNPLAVSTDMQTKTAISQATSDLSAASGSLAMMNTTQAAVSEMASVLNGLQTIVNQAINTPNETPQTLGALSQQAGQLISQLGQLSDTKYGNNYVFGGYQTETPPSTYVFTNTSPTGTTSAPTVQFSNGTQVQTSVLGTDLFQTPPAGKTVSLSQTLQTLVSDIQGGNSGTLSTDLANLQAQTNHVINQNAELGTRINQIQAYANQTTNYQTLLLNQQSNLENANMAQVLTQFSNEQTVYTAALKLGQQILMPTLFTYLP